MARFTIKRFLHDALVAAWGSPPPPEREEPVGNFEGQQRKMETHAQEEGDLEDECNTTARVWFRDANPPPHTPSLPNYPIRIFFSLIVYVPANNTVAPSLSYLLPLVGLYLLGLFP